MAFSSRRNYQADMKPTVKKPAWVIEKERARLPEAIFRQEYEAAFLEGAGAVFRNVRDCATGAFEDYFSASDKNVPAVQSISCCCACHYYLALPRPSSGSGE